MQFEMAGLGEMGAGQTRGWYAAATKLWLRI